MFVGQASAGDGAGGASGPPRDSDHGRGRRGKILIIETETRTLLFHLKMTGQFLWLRPDRPRDKHTHLVLSFSDAPEELRFRDVRKFGFMRCLPSGEVAACGEIARLGPEPLEISRKDF